MTEAKGLTTTLARPVDIAWLAAFRVLFGLTMCTSMLRFIGYGWVESFFLRPRFHFKYWGFSWVEALPAPLMHALFWALAALGLAIALGLFFRAATFAFAVGFTYLQLVDVTTYLNHYYLASLLALLLALSPAHRAYSLDAKLRPALRVAQIPNVWLLLFRFQVGVVYTFAGLAKAHADWLLHAQPLSIWLAARTDLPLIGALFRYEHSAHVMSWAGFLFDSSVPWLLLMRRTRPYAFALVIVFHVLTRVLFPIGMFPVIMVLSALVFFAPNWPRRLFALRRVRTRAAMAPARNVSAPPMRQVGYALCAAYCALQLLVPLRFLAYGGDVRWHEQGMRFSWRVMVREKNGSVTFRVREPDSAIGVYVAPERYLTPLQVREMASQPDLILQFAHFLRDEYARRGVHGVEVRAEALASMNGRPMAPLIDPNVDLAKVRDGLARASWILPVPADPPPSLRTRSHYAWSQTL